MQWPGSGTLSRTVSLIVTVLGDPGTSLATRKSRDISWAAATKTRVPDAKTGIPDIYKRSLSRDADIHESSRRRER